MAEYQGQSATCEGALLSIVSTFFLLTFVPQNFYIDKCLVCFRFYWSTLPNILSTKVSRQRYYSHLKKLRSCASVPSIRHTMLSIKLAFSFPAHQLRFSGFTISTSRPFSRSSTCYYLLSTRCLTLSLACTLFL